LKKRSLNLLLAMGLILGAFVGVFGTAGAQPIAPPMLGSATESASSAYFPWVPNGNVTVDPHGFGETGPWYGTITLQNLELSPALIDIYVDGEVAQTITLYPWASTTISAGDLGIEEGSGAAVEARGFQHRGAAAGDGAGMPVCLIEFADGGHLLFPLGGYPGDAIVHCQGIAAQLEVPGRVVVDSAIILPGHPLYPAHLDPGQDIAPVLARIAGVQKQASPVPAPNARTGSEHIIVDGYTALTGDEVAVGQHVLPIVQTNNFWNTEIRVANFSDTTTPVTVTLYEAFGAGATGTSAGSFVENIPPYSVATFDLGDLGFADPPYTDPDPVNNWVGTAYISSNQPVGAVAERVKAQTDMLVMNRSQPMGEGGGFQAAPLVFQEYNFWNTGISVVNTSDTNNSVTVTYYGPTMNVVGQDQLTIPARGMEYVYTPGTQDLGLGGVGQAGFVGSAKIEGTASFQASVDEVKYFGDDAEVGHAMSYIAEDEFATGARLDDDGFGIHGDLLALPLVQKGVVDNGIAHGDTSGIQLFNASADNSVTAHVWFFDSTGLLVAPTLTSPMSVTLSPHQNYTLYAHNLHELPTNFQGSAIIQVSGAGLLAGVSNNVNYDVQGDGSVAYNLVRVPGLQVDAPEVVDITLEPEFAENPFYGQAELDAAAVAAIEAELEFWGVVIGDYDVAARLAAHGGVLADLVDEIQLEFGLTAFQASQVLVAAQTAVAELNQHTVTATVTVNGEAWTDGMVQFDVEGANVDGGLEPLDTLGQATFTYTATAPGEDTITAWVPGAVGEATATKVWIGVGDEAVDLILDPVDAENPFYLDVAWVQAQAIAGLGIEFFGDDAEVIYAIILSEGPDTAAFVAYLELLVAEETITEDELGLIVDAWLGVNVHTVTATFVDAFGNPVNIAGLVEGDYDVEIRVLDQFGTPQYTIAADDIVLVVDADTGVATISYLGDPLFDGSDLILVSVTVGEGDDAVTFTAEATKTWVPVDVDDNGNGVVDGFVLELDPAFAANRVPPFSAAHTVTATVTDDDDNVVVLAEGDVVVTATRNGTVLAPTVEFNAEGEAEITVIGPANASILPPGQTLTDTIVVTVTVNDTVLEQTAIKVWTGVGGGPQ
jgi:hypothetical protein